MSRLPFVLSATPAVPIAIVSFAGDPSIASVSTEKKLGSQPPRSTLIGMSRAFLGPLLFANGPFCSEIDSDSAPDGDPVATMRSVFAVVAVPQAPDQDDWIVPPVPTYSV